METANTCPDCDARLNAGETCQSIFDSFLALEFSDPAYGAVHFLTVACFMIQHNQYSDEALAWMKEKLRAYLEEGITITELRRQASSEMGDRDRAWKVMRSAGERTLPEIAWQVTIADVAAHAGDAEDYCGWVRRWGEATVRQMV